MPGARYRAADDFYGVLGVRPDASPHEIRSAYRRLVRASHPDLNPSDEGAGERMARVNHAARVLLDAELRAAYDRVRPRAESPASASVWYERSPVEAGEWVAPVQAPREPAPRAFARYLRELRALEARGSLALGELVASTPRRARVPLLALCLAAALLLIGSARPRAWSGAARPTSVAPVVLAP